MVAMVKTNSKRRVKAIEDSLSVVAADIDQMPVEERRVVLASLSRIELLAGQLADRIAELE